MKPIPTWQEIAIAKHGTDLLPRYEERVCIQQEINALRERLAELENQKPCASISHCSLNGAEDCTCGVVGPCEKLTDVYLAAGANESHLNGGMTGWPPGLLQDDSRGLSRWLSSRPDALHKLRQLYSETPDVEGHPV